MNRHRFGSTGWTTQKLDILSKYIGAYVKIMSGKGFHFSYVDAFAGSGAWLPSPTETGDGVQDFIGGDVEPIEQDGSVRIALKAFPQFSEYYFVELNKNRCASLENLRAEFPGLRERIHICREDANKFLSDFCNQHWSGHRALVFLDPYGMQVEWRTIEAIARTKCIDLWYLFPLGMGVARLLTRSGSIEDALQRKLDSFLGTTEWRTAFYNTEHSHDLAGEREEVIKTATFKTIADFFLERLGQIFAGVAPNPLLIENSAGNPMYLLCFASGNPKGSPIAIKIAEHILGAHSRTKPRRS